jgi:hypothetical protein
MTTTLRTSTVTAAMATTLTMGTKRAAILPGSRS